MTFWWFDVREPPSVRFALSLLLGESLLAVPALPKDACEVCVRACVAVWWLVVARWLGRRAESLVEVAFVVVELEGAEPTTTTVEVEVTPGIDRAEANEIHPVVAVAGTVPLSALALATGAA